MIPFYYQRAEPTESAVKSIGIRGAKFLGGGTNLVDLMKLNVERPSTLMELSTYFVKRPARRTAQRIGP